jgi:hypothetical protein
MNTYYYSLLDNDNNVVTKGTIEASSKIEAIIKVKKQIKGTDKEKLNLFLSRKENK